MRKNSTRLTELMTLLVFAVFALCIMWLLLTGTGVYKRLTAASEESYETRVRGQYLATRIRQSQYVEVAPFADADALALGETIEGETYVTWVYLHDGYLWELFSDRDSPPDPEDGEKILPASVLELKLDGQMLYIRTDSEFQWISVPAGKEVPK